MKTSGVYDRACQDSFGWCLEFKAVRTCITSNEWCSRQYHDLSFQCVLAERTEQGFCFDDTGRGRPERAVGGYVGFESVEEIGIHDFQIVDSIPAAPWDVPLDMLITETGPMELKSPNSVVP